MTTNNSSFVPIQYPQHNVVHPQTLGVRDHELWSNEHLPGISGPYPAVNPADSDALPPGPTRYTSTMGNEDRDPPRVPVVIGVGQHRGNQIHRQLDPDHPTPGITQYIPIDPGPPPLEQYLPAIPEVPNNCPTGNMIPLPHNVAGASRGETGLVHSRMSVSEDLKKNLASHYLYNPGSRVKDFRTRRSRSGAVKVLILLEMEDDM